MSTVAKKNTSANNKQNYPVMYSCPVWSIRPTLFLCKLIWRKYIAASVFESLFSFVVCSISDFGNMVYKLPQLMPQLIDHKSWVVKVYNVAMKTTGSKYTLINLWRYKLSGIIANNAKLTQKVEQWHPRIHG